MGGRRHKLRESCKKRASETVGGAPRFHQSPTSPRVIVDAHSTALTSFFTDTRIVQKKRSSLCGSPNSYNGIKYNSFQIIEN